MCGKHLQEDINIEKFAGVMKFVKETKDLENNYQICSVMCEIIQAMKKKVGRQHSPKKKDWKMCPINRDKLGRRRAGKTQ